MLEVKSLFKSFGGVAAISGAQDPQILANAIEQIANNRDKFLAEARAAQGAPA